MRGLTLCLLSWALFSLVAITAANAEMKPLDPFATEIAPAGSPPATPPSAFANPGAAQESPGAYGGLFGWVLRTQQSLQRDLATGVKSLKGDHAVTGAVMLAALKSIEAGAAPSNLGYEVIINSDEEVGSAGSAAWRKRRLT